MSYQITGKTAILNGMDLTALGVITRAGYSVEYVPVDGGQGGFMQDGSTKEDELGIKTIVSFPLMPMQESLNSRLLKTVYDSAETRLTYFDPKTGKDRTMRTLRGRLSPMTYRGFGGDGNAYWAGRADAHSRRTVHCGVENRFDAGQDGLRLRRTAGFNRIGSCRYLFGRNGNGRNG